MTQPSIRDIFGAELKLVFERFNGETPKRIRFRSMEVKDADELIQAVTNNQYMGAYSFTVDKSVTLVTDRQARATISFFGTTPAVMNDHYLSVTVFAEVTHDGSADGYVLNIVGTGGHQQIPTGASIDDLLANASASGPAKHYLRGNLSLNMYADLTSVLSQEQRYFTGLPTAKAMLSVAEDNYDAIRMAVNKALPNETLSLDLELESAIWFSNVHRYNALEPMFNTRSQQNRNPASLTDMGGPLFEDIVSDLELMLYLTPQSNTWLERWYLSLQVEGIGGIEMLRARLKYTEDLLARGRIFKTEAFSLHETAMREYLERTKVNVVASLQHELIAQKKKDEDDVSTVPAPTVKPAEEIKKTSSGKQLGQFEMEYEIKVGSRVFLEFHRPEEQPVRIGATVDIHDRTCIDFTGDDGENYTVWWGNWSRNDGCFIVEIEGEEKAFFKTFVYEIVEE